MEKVNKIFGKTASDSRKGKPGLKLAGSSLLVSLWLLFSEPVPAMALVPDGKKFYAAGSLSLGILLGLLLALALYGLNMFCVMRKRCYVWYSVLVAWSAGYLLLIQPLTRSYMSEFPVGLRHGVIQMALAGVVIAGGSFARTFMQTAGDTQDLVLVDRLLLTAILLGGCMVLMVSPGQGGMREHIFMVLALAAALVVAGATLLASFKGVARARYLLLAGLAAGGGGVVEIFSAQGIVPPYPLLANLFEIGCCGGLLMLGCALGDNIKALHHETESLRRSERKHMELAVTDGLTGLFNMRYFRMQLDLEIQRAEQLGQPFTLMMMDVDNFKVFNDCFGHLEGDRILRRLGALINSVIRDQDMACRYGGEEFAVILPGSHYRAALIVHERLQKALRNWNQFEQEEMLHPVTLSVGVSQYVIGEGADELIARTDRAMYDAKEGGRDQLVLSVEDDCPSTREYSDCFTGL